MLKKWLMVIPNLSTHNVTISGVDKLQCLEWTRMIEPQESYQPPKTNMGQEQKTGS